MKKHIVILIVGGMLGSMTPIDAQRAEAEALKKEIEQNFDIGDKKSKVYEELLSLWAARTRLRPALLSNTSYERARSHMHKLDQNEERLMNTLTSLHTDLKKSNERIATLDNLCRKTNCHS